MTNWFSNKDTNNLRGTLPNLSSCTTLEKIHIRKLIPRKLIFQVSQRLIAPCKTPLFVPVNNRLTGSIPALPTTLKEMHICKLEANYNDKKMYFSTHVLTNCFANIGNNNLSGALPNLSSCTALESFSARKLLWHEFSWVL